MRAAILDLLLGSHRKTIAAAAGLDSSRSWPAVIDMCTEWRVLPQLNRRLAECGIGLPAETRATLRQATVKAFLQTSRRIERGVAALEILSRAGIPCAGFKGIAVVAILYGSPGARTLQDADVLIRKHDLPKALTELERGGYAPTISRSLEDYVAFVRNSPGFAGNEAIELSDGRGGSIDLHWRLGRLDTEMLLTGTQEVQLFGKSIRVVRAPHCMTLAAHHALRNDFVPDEMVRDLLDCRDWLPWIEQHGETVETIEIARQNRVWGAALALIRLSGDFAETPAAGAFLADAPVGEELRIAADLAELFKSQVKEELLNADLVYLADARSIRQIVAGASSGWARYRSHMKAFEQANGRMPVKLGLRLRRLAIAAWRMPLRRWRLVRTLAIAKNAGAR